MHPSQRESCAVVAKGSIRPRNRVVALLAGLGKVGAHVIRVGRSLVVLQVASHASRT